ncbi:MAG: hypothetical protein HZC41_06680 [Chloroflexi bacterium]|nr:hypothetical protein [Chloroflexota bacterium]
MKHLYWAVTILLLSIWLIVPAAAHPTPLPEFIVQADPVSLIGSYYNAIDRGDYTRAYHYWERPPQNMTEAQFVAGFADTVNAEVIVRLPVLIGAAAGNSYADVPTLVIAEHGDGTVHYYAGCFTAHKTNVPVGSATEPDPNWYIQDGTLSEQTAPDFAALERACANTAPLPNPDVPPGQLDPAPLIESYIAALVVGDRQQALSYWQNGQNDTFAATYGSRLTTAAQVSLLVNPVIIREGAAGSLYAPVAALSIITAADGMPSYVTACFTTRRSNVPQGDNFTPDPNWFIVNAASNEVGSPRMAVTALTENCTGQPAAG